MNQALYAHVNNKRKKKELLKKKKRRIKSWKPSGMFEEEDVFISVKCY
jgi:hypothetical protein